MWISACHLETKNLGLSQYKFGGIPFYGILHGHIPQIITTKMMLWCVCKHLHFKEINDKPCQTLRCPIVRKTHMGLSCPIFRHNHILHSLSSLIPNYQVAGFNMSKNRLGICVSCVCCLGFSIYIFFLLQVLPVQSLSLSLQRYLRGVGVKHLSTVKFF